MGVPRFPWTWRWRWPSWWTIISRSCYSRSYCSAVTGIFIACKSRQKLFYIYIDIRLLGRFMPIFHFNCEHVLFVYIGKQNKKGLRISSKNFVDFQMFKNLMKIEFWWRHNFEILIIHKPSLGSREVPHKIWARLV